jgi:hypothetical protein
MRLVYSYWRGKGNPTGIKTTEIMDAGYGMRDSRCGILDARFWIVDASFFCIYQNPASRIQNPASFFQYQIDTHHSGKDQHSQWMILRYIVADLKHIVVG